MSQPQSPRKKRGLEPVTVKTIRRGVRFGYRLVTRTQEIKGEAVGYSSREIARAEGVKAQAQYHSGVIYW